MNKGDNENRSIAVVIPTFRAASSIVEVIERIPASIDRIIVVDDACPEESGRLVRDSVDDKRVSVIFRERNGGVGAAMRDGFREALRAGVDIVVKLDADGQVDPELIPGLVLPIQKAEADYAKGNRFFDVESLQGMPALRLIGNGLLSFINKLVSGYWPVMDPTNGFVAIHAAVLRHLPLDKLADDYFFESDMLFRLSTLRAVVIDMPMASSYKDENSSLRIGRVLLSFPGRYLGRFMKRLAYNYFIRDFSMGSILLLGGLGFSLAGSIYGGLVWYDNASSGVATPVGQVMLAALPIIIGMQMLLAAINFDVQSVPRSPIFPRLKDISPRSSE